MSLFHTVSIVRVDIDSIFNDACTYIYIHIYYYYCYYYSYYHYTYIYTDRIVWIILNKYSYMNISCTHVHICMWSCAHAYMGMYMYVVYIYYIILYYLYTHTLCVIHTLNSSGSLMITHGLVKTSIRMGCPRKLSQIATFQVVSDVQC